MNNQPQKNLSIAQSREYVIQNFSHIKVEFSKLGTKFNNFKHRKRMQNANNSLYMYN